MVRLAENFCFGILVGIQTTPSLFKAGQWWVRGAKEAPQTLGVGEIVVRHNAPTRLCIAHSCYGIFDDHLRFVRLHEGSLWRGEVCGALLHIQSKRIDGLDGLHKKNAN